MDEVLQRVRPRLVPTPEEVEEVEAAADRLVEAVDAACEDLDVDAEPLLVGSTAKGTWLRDDLDIDCFLCFPPDVSREDLERDGLAVGREVLGGDERYAEHPYIEGTWEGHKADVVPCYRVASPDERMTAVDRTPFHNEYVIEHLDDAQRTDVRYLKGFLHGIDAYGANTRTQGFSGYLAELLVLAYGSFRSVVEAARDWAPPVTIDLEDHGERTFDEPLVVVDPVDGRRNAAAAVSEARLRRFVEACAAFLDDPDERFFFPEPVPVLDAGTLGGRLVGEDRTTFGLAGPRPGLVEDNLYPQLRRAQNSVADHLAREGFTVVDADHFADGDRCLVVWTVEPARLEATYEHRGPPADRGAHAERFRKKWEGHDDAVGPVVERDGRLFVEVRRSRRTPAEVVEPEMDQLGLGKQLGAVLTEEGAFAGPDELAADPFRAWMSAYVDDRRPWER